MVLALNHVPVRIIEKDDNFHFGQRGPGIQPRTIEVFKFLNILDDVMANSIALPMRRSYQMPEGIKTQHEFHMFGEEAWSPDTPYVRTPPQPAQLSSVYFNNVSISAELDHNWTRPPRRNISSAFEEAWRMRRATDRAYQFC